jgi:hypothetical protein
MPLNPKLRKFQAPINKQRIILKLHVSMTKTDSAGNLGIYLSIEKSLKNMRSKD